MNQIFLNLFIQSRLGYSVDLFIKCSFDLFSYRSTCYALCNGVSVYAYLSYSLFYLLIDYS